METILRWAGSKRQLLSKLKSHWPGGKSRYVEPFCGSACLFFDLEPHCAILGDLNSELIATYEALRRNARHVCEYLASLPHREDTYYQIRACDPDDLNETERAVRFLFLNGHCFNGIYRTNQKGEFNVPYGAKTKTLGFNYEQICRAAELLGHATLINGDFATTLNCVGPGDFVYLDPPYVVSDRRIFAQYHKDTFSASDLERLGESLRELNEMGATFVISYADSREARTLLAPWRPNRVRTRRHVAGFAGDRRIAYELMATNSDVFCYAQ
jgi:DNA adenine methylase